MTETLAPPTVTMPSTTLRDALTAALLAVDTTGSLAVLGMVHIAKTANNLVVRATNRHHLLEATVQLEDATGADQWEALLDGPDIKQILTVLPKKPAKVTVGPDDGMAFVVGVEDGASLRLRLQDQDFPKTDGLFVSERIQMERVRLDSKLLTALFKMPGHDRYVTFEFCGESKPLISQWSDERTRIAYRYLLMAAREDR